MLAEFNLPADQIKQTANHVNKAARRMEHLLVEIGQVARAKPGQREECLVEDLVTSAVESQEAKAATQHVVVNRFTQGDLKVRCEGSRVERVLVNLIANSLDVMPGGGEISIRDWSAGGTVWIEITDSGPGVPAEIRAKLFEPFVTAGKTDGLGLGLALARQTMHRAQWRLGICAVRNGRTFSSAPSTGLKPLLPSQPSYNWSLVA